MHRLTRTVVMTQFHAARLVEHNAAAKMRSFRYKRATVFVRHAVYSTYQQTIVLIMLFNVNTRREGRISRRPFRPHWLGSIVLRLCADIDSIAVCVSGGRPNTVQQYSSCIMAHADENITFKVFGIFS